MKYIPGKLFFLFLALAGVTGCNDDDNEIVPNQTQPTDQVVNNWIHSVMKEVYYWTADIPENVNPRQDPVNYFHALLSPEDRFSVIVPNYDELINALNGVNLEAGYEFALARQRDTENVLAVILYVKKNSPAADAGLKRGDEITHINGTLITLTNYQSLLDDISSNHTISYRRFNEEQNEYEQNGPVDLNAVVLAENPNFLDTVYTIGTNKIGYYVYNFFSPGTENSTTYDDQMDQIIGEFKNKGVNALILDLRYNSGGAGSSARNMASLIGTGVTSNDIFYKNQYNDNFQDYFESQDAGEAELAVKFLDEAENIGGQINGHVYILTGSRTASASELIINGLMPYMNVTIVGDTTVGKNVGSIPIEDTENPENTYGLLPIVFKAFNSEGFSDYDEGFIPLMENTVQDLQAPLKALGDIEEPLLARAIELVTGSSPAARRALPEIKHLDLLMSSLDLKLRSNRLILEREGF